MAEFNVDYNKGIEIAKELDSYKNSISSIQTRLENVARNLDGTSNSISTIKSKISSISNNFSQQKKKMGYLAVGLDSCMKIYKTTENEIKTSDYMSLTNVSESGAVVSGTIGTSIVTSTGLLEVSGSGEVIGGSYSRYGEGGLKYEDGKLEEASIQAGIKGEGHLAQVSGEVNYGLLHGETEINVGQVEGYGEVKATLFEDGKLAPGLALGVGASVAAVTGEVEGSIGNESNNVHGNAEGSLLEAEAEAEVKAGVVTYKDKKGEVHTDVGVSAKVEAETYLAEGTVSGGITIFGIDIDVGLTGKAGGIGATAEGHVTKGSVGASVGVGAIVGAEVSFNVDFSNFKLPKIKLGK